MDLMLRLWEVAESERIYLRAGAIVTDGAGDLHAAFNGVDFDRLHRCIENNIMLEDGCEEISWSGTIEDYLSDQGGAA